MRQAAQLADAMGLEALVPVARWKGFGGVTNYGAASFETLSWAAALAAQTETIYVFATCHVPVIHPIIAAKQLVTIDHVSGGRCGLNVVGGWHRSAVLGDHADALRNRFIAGWGGVPLVGTPDAVADGLAAISTAGYDGCLLMFPRWEEGLGRFRDQVLPLLEKEGLRHPLAVARPA